MYSEMNSPSYNQLLWVNEFSKAVREREIDFKEDLMTLDPRGRKLQELVDLTKKWLKEEARRKKKKLPVQEPDKNTPEDDEPELVKAKKRPSPVKHDPKTESDLKKIKPIKPRPRIRAKDQHEINKEKHEEAKGPFISLSKIKPIVPRPKLTRSAPPTVLYYEEENRVRQEVYTKFLKRQEPKILFEYVATSKLTNIMVKPTPIEYRIFTNIFNQTFTKTIPNRISIRSVPVKI